MGLSTNTYTYTSGPQTFSASFADGYIEKDHVKVYTPGALNGLGEQIYLTFTWNSADEVLVSDTLTTGTLVTVERTVPKDHALVDLDAPGAITREGLSRNNRQAMHATHELTDGRIPLLVDAIASLDAHTDDAAASAASASASASTAAAAALATGTYKTDMPGVLASGTAATNSIMDARKEGASFKVAGAVGLFNAWTNPNGYLLAGAANNFFVNSGRNDLRASSFATFTDSDDAVVADANSAALQRAIDWLYVNGGGALTFDGDVRVPVRAPLALRSNVHLIGRGALLENIRTSAVAGLSLSANAIVLGSGALIDDDDYAWVAIKAAVAGQEYVEAVSGSTAWTAVGREIQFLRATASNFGGPGDTGNFDSHHIRRVIKIAGSRVYVDRPIQEAIPLDGAGTLGTSVAVGGGWAVDVSFATAASRGAGLVSCAPRHAISRASVSDLSLKARAGNVMSRTMLHDCLLENIRVLPSETAVQLYGLAGNFFSHCRVKNWKAPFWVRGLEVVGHSKDTTLEALNLWKHLPAGVTPTADPADGDEEETQIRVSGENTRGVVVRNSVFDCGVLVTENPVVTFSTGEGTVFTGNHVTAYGAGALVSFSPTDRKHFVAHNKFVGTCQTGISLKGTSNAVLDNDLSDVVAAVRAVAIDSTARGCAVSKNRFSAGSTALVSSNSGVIDLCTISDNTGLDSVQLAGSAEVQRNRTQATSRIRAAVVGSVSSTGVSATTTAFTELVTPIVIPANTLRAGDTIDVELSGSKTGAAGTATVSVKVAVDTDNDGVGQDADDTTSTMVEFTVPAASGSDWILRGKITLTSDTRLQGAFTAFTSAGVAVNEISVLNLTFGTNPLRIEMLGKVAVSGDTVLRRTLDAEFKRRGFN